MSVTNERRHRLHDRFDQLLGKEDANTVMDLLPPAGRGDVATDSDIDELRLEMQAGFREVRLEMRTGLAELRAEMHKGQRDLVFAMIGSNVSIAALAVAASQLI